MAVHKTGESSSCTGQSAPNSSDCTNLAGCGRMPNKVWTMTLGTENSQDKQDSDSRKLTIMRCVHQDLFHSSLVAKWIAVTKMHAPTTRLGRIVAHNRTWAATFTLGEAQSLRQRQFEGQTVARPPAAHRRWRIARTGWRCVAVAEALKLANVDVRSCKDLQEGWTELRCEELDDAGSATGVVLFG
jgi:hypothetical protein